MSRTTIRNFIVASVLLLLAGTVFGYMVHASGTKQQLLVEELETINKQEAQEAAYLQAKRVAQDSAEERALLDAMFLSTESDSIDFLNDVEGLAAQYGVSLKTESLEVIEDKKKKTKSLETNFTFSGDKEQVYRFVELLEQLEYVAEIVQLDVAARSSTNWEAKTRVAIKLQEYAE